MAGRRWVKFQQFFFIKLRRRKKKTQLQFFVSSPILNQRRPIRYVLRLIQWQNLKRKIVAVSFSWRRIILMTNSKFRTPLTLSSHKSGLKDYSHKNHHIFRTSRTSAFIYHPWIPLKLILTLRLITILALCWIFSSPDPNLTSRVLLEATIIKKHWNFLSGSTTRRSSPSWLLGCSLALGRSGPPSVERSCQ